MKRLLHIFLAIFLLVGLSAPAYSAGPFWPKRTGQETVYMKGGDGDEQRGVPHDYTTLTTGDQSGTTNVSILDNTDAISNEYVWDNRTGLGWQRYVTDGLGSATDGKLYWLPWTLLNKTDISFTALVGADVLIRQKLVDLVVSDVAALLADIYEFGNFSVHALVAHTANASKHRYSAGHSPF